VKPETGNSQPYHSPLPEQCNSVHPFSAENFVLPGPHRVSTWPAASVSGLALEGLLGTGRLLGKLHESHLGSIFLGVVDKLTIVPVAGCNVSALDGNGAGPGSATSWRCPGKSGEHFGVRPNMVLSLSTRLPRRSEMMLKTGALRCVFRQYS
jgi:hypothetical protein